MYPDKCCCNGHTAFGSAGCLCSAEEVVNSQHLLNYLLSESEVKVKISCVAYCYETIIFQYVIVTDRAEVQPIGCRLGPRPQAQACG